IRRILERLEAAVEGERNSLTHWAASRFAEMLGPQLSYEEAHALIVAAAMRAGLSLSRGEQHCPFRSAGVRMSPRKPQPQPVGGKTPDLIVHAAERSATARALAHIFANEPQPRIFARIDGTPVFVVRVPNAAAELRVLSRDHLIIFAHDLCQPIKRT